MHNISITYISNLTPSLFTTQVTYDNLGYLMGGIVVVVGILGDMFKHFLFLLE